MIKWNIFPLPVLVKEEEEEEEEKESVKFFGFLFSKKLEKRERKSE